MARDANGRFLKGSCGNPNPKPGPGRPPIAKSLSELIRKAGEEEAAGGKTRNQALAEGLWLMALQGETEKSRLAATREILDRTEGRAPVKVDISNSDGSLIKGYPAELLETLT